MKDRLKELRNALNLTQTEFGKRIGSSRDAIAAYERGVAIKEPIIKLICKEFGVDYFWLTEGKGEMFIETPDDIIDQVVKEYGLSEKAKAVIKAYVQMDDQQRKSVEDYFLSIAETLNKQKKDSEK